MRKYLATKAEHDALKAQVGSWQSPVASVDALPTVGNTLGDIRLVLADFTLRAWDGAAWRQVAGGGGVTPPPGGTPQNLFIQDTQPTVDDIIIDSMWIPIVDGLPADAVDWQFFTGTGDGDGGNLIIGPNEPDVLVDTLWVKTTAAGTVSNFYEMKPLTGYGSVEGYGNPNLFFSSTQPAGVTFPALWVVLDATTQIAKSPDLWRVFT